MRFAPTPEAAQRWLEPILASGLTPRQKRQLLTRLAQHPHLVQASKRLRRPDLLGAWEDAVRSLAPGGV